MLADVLWHDGSPVVQSPRQILRQQLERLAERGLSAYVGTELEFVVYHDTYEEAQQKGYRGLTPANGYNVDYSLLGTTRVEPLLRAIRLGMAGAGLEPESAKGECNLGQHEIAFRYAEALKTADQHSIYKHGAKEIAAQHGHVADVHGQAEPARGQLVSHPLLAAIDESGQPVMADGDALSATGRAGAGRAAGHDRRVERALRAEHQLLQALPGGLVRADGAALGARQPHLRAAPGRPRPVAAGGAPRRRAGTSTPTWRSRR